MSQSNKIVKKNRNKSKVFNISVVVFSILLIISIVFIINKLSSSTTKEINKPVNSSSNGTNKSDTTSTEVLGGDATMSVTKDSDLIINVSDITEQATFYPVEVDGTKLEVLAVKAPDGSIRTAFNTCQVCYDSGRGYYKQEGDQLICQNCGNSFGMGDVEVTKGGCNPVPISSEDKIEDDTAITISKDYLVEAKVIFGNWK